MNTTDQKQLTNDDIKSYWMNNPQQYVVWQQQYAASLQAVPQQQTSAATSSKASGVPGAQQTINAPGTTKTGDTSGLKQTGSTSNTEQTGNVPLPQEDVKSENVANTPAKQQAASNGHRNKPRPPVNEEDVAKGYFYLQPCAVSVMKKYFFETCHSISDVLALSEEQSRFQYYFSWKNFAFAKKHSKKKPASLRTGRAFNCNGCDEFFYTKDEITAHLKTNRHKEIRKIYDTLKVLGLEWYSCRSKPNHVLSDDALIAESSGIEIYTSETEQDQVRKAQSRRTIPITEEIFLGLDPLTMSEDDFVWAAYENIMDVHWPKPTTPHSCQCCNFISFDKAELLEEHKQTSKHMQSQLDYDDSWCVTCHYHTCSKEGLERHKQTPRHLMMKRLLADTRTYALRFYRKTRGLQQHAEMAKGRHQQLSSLHLEKEMRRAKRPLALPDDVSLSWRRPGDPDDSFNPHTPKRAFHDDMFDRRRPVRPFQERDRPPMGLNYPPPMDFNYPPPRMLPPPPLMGGECPPLPPLMGDLPYFGDYPNYPKQF